MRAALVALAVLAAALVAAAPAAGGCALGPCAQGDYDGDQIYDPSDNCPVNGNPTHLARPPGYRTCTIGRPAAMHPASSLVTATNDGKP